ncbi:MAG TPA: redoxin domain-containing protein [Cyclobacteriaceae bacterium]|nr:redoxin domain-containing protein [Cyclobacteriaceae bacterium]
MHNLFISLLLLLLSLPAYAQMVNNFSLKDVVSGNEFVLSQHQSATAVVLVFTSNSCPYSKLYESRIADLATRFIPQGFRFALINPHADAAEGESAAEMVKRSGSTLAGLPYLSDQSQSVTRALNITKLPQVVVVTPSPQGFSVAYEGGIDNNPQLPQSATQTYLEDALQSIIQNKTAQPASTRAVGCNVKSP